MKKVLVIGYQQSSYQKLFYSDKFLTISVKNGLEGIRTAKDLIPDTIICNEQLPDIDGFQVINELKRSQISKNIPIILISDKLPENIQKKFTNESNTFDYINSAYNFETLLKSIESRLNVGKGFTEANRLNSSKSNTQSLIKLHGRIKWVSLKSRNAEFLHVNKIMYLFADEDYTIVFTENGEKILVKKQLKKWEEILPKNSFLRICDSIIVNVHYIIDVEECPDNIYFIYIQDIQKPFKVEEKYTPRLKSSLIKPASKINN